MADDQKKLTYIFLNKKDIEEKYQPMSDEELETVSKEVIGAINELNVRFKELKDKIEMDDTARSIVNEALVNITLLAAAPVDDLEDGITENTIWDKDGLYNETVWIGGDLITDVKLNKNEHAMYELSARVVESAEDIENLQKRITEIDGDIVEIDEDISNIIKSINELTASDENIDTKIVNINTEITNVKAKMDKIDQTFLDIRELIADVKPSTLVVKEYHEIAELEDVQQGGMVYVESDSNKNGDANIYVIISVKENEEGVIIPDEYVPLNQFTKSDVPTLSYDDSMPEGLKVYLNAEDDFIIRFKFDSDTYGDGKYKIYRDGMLLKSFSDAKGTVIVNLGPMVTDGSYEITVNATDFLGIPAPQTLTYNVVVGGLKFTSTFEETIRGQIFEVNDIVEFPYIVSVSDSESKIKVKFNLNGPNDYAVEEIVNIDGIAASGKWSSEKIPARGLYTISAQAYTGETPEDVTPGTFASPVLSYNFNVLTEGEIAIIDELKERQFDDNTYISIPFRVTSKIANYFTTRGKLYKLNDAGEWELHSETSLLGIECTMNVTSYWSVKKLPVGNYKYELTAYTVDGEVRSLESAIGEITVVQSSYQRVKPIMTNLVAWFDANEKSNVDADRDVWYNNAALDPKYIIQLHDLNYSTNGWKHVDETLADSDDGELMLKFTGDSYGELLVLDDEGNTSSYKPFDVFSNAGIQGFALETAFRTRCVGDFDAKVITCMESNKTDSPGMAIGVDKLFLGSNAQVSNLSFTEDEWIHVTFVVDRSIRTQADVGQDNIENLNPVRTLRMYINGVLCSCSAFRDDSFLDASGRAFPLLLNACLGANGDMVNFGESEIKFIRIYESYLTSSDVLNNYISHIYDTTEQQMMKDRNDITKATLPTVVFKRNILSSNTSTFSLLNSITDKKESKKVCVDCAMEYNDGEGNITVMNNVDVYLQGTSSLQYPVKNYKIKAYQDDDHKIKNKFTPPGKEDEWVPDYTYTLKCD